MRKMREEAEQQQQVKNIIKQKEEKPKNKKKLLNHGWLLSLLSVCASLIIYTLCACISLTIYHYSHG